MYELFLLFFRKIHHDDQFVVRVTHIINLSLHSCTHAVECVAGKIMGYWTTILVFGHRVYKIGLIELGSD